MTVKKKLYGLSAAVAALVIVVAVLAIVPKIGAQDAYEDDPSGRVARLAYMQGSVSLEPAGESDWVEAVSNRPLTIGDRLWTDRGSRAELQLGSAAIRLDSNTDFSFLNLDDRSTQIQLAAGALNIRVRWLDRDEIFEIDTPNQAFWVTQPGPFWFPNNQPQFIYPPFRDRRTLDTIDNRAREPQTLTLIGSGLRILLLKIKKEVN